MIYPISQIGAPPSPGINSGLLNSPAYMSSVGHLPFGIFNLNDLGTGPVSSTLVGNTCIIWTVPILFPVRFTKISLRVSSAVAGKHAGFGIYTANGLSRIFDMSNAFDMAAANTIRSVATSLVLGAGLYRFAMSADPSSILSTTGGFTQSGSSGPAFLQNFNASRNGYGGGVNVDGAMPAQVGTIIDLSPTGLALPYLFFEP